MESMESMDTSDANSEDTSHITIGCGRGRGHRWPNNRPGIGSPPKVAATHVSDRSEPSVRPKSSTCLTSTSNTKSRPIITNKGSPLNQKSCEMTSEESLQRATERTGISVGFFDEYFKLDGDMSRFAPMMTLPNHNWHNDNKPEIKEEDKDNDPKERKYRGIQYVSEAHKYERQNILELRKKEKENRKEQNIESQSNQCSGRVGHNVSTLSLQTSVSTNVESVGTFQPLDRMDTIIEDEDRSFIDKYFSPEKTIRQKLPIGEYEDRIIKAVNACRVVIIEGATGCGKTTQVPQYIADDCASKGVPFNIVVTQPRRIAARSIATRVAQERDWQLGTIIGYQIGMDSSTVNEETRLLYCTTGVLLQKLINNQKMDNYSHIIIDEVHERSIETDLLLLVIKKLMTTKSLSVKIILMSATFDVSELIEYFSIPIYNEDDDDDEEPTSKVSPTHIKVKERPQKLHTYYIDSIKRELNINERFRDERHRQIDPSEKDMPYISNEAMEVALKILEKGIPSIESVGSVESRGSVLVFLPGLEEIHEMKVRLEKSPEKIKQQWDIHPLHSSVPLEKQNLVFQLPRGRQRRIILATNIAESSITVPDVQYVIDFCLTKTLVMDYETHIPVLKMEWASKANCIQRGGRAGRCTEGRVYRLVGEKFFQNTMSEFSQPELNRSPLDLSILRVKMLNMGPPKHLLGLALTPPDLADIYHSVLQLKQVGAFSVMTTVKGTVIYEDEDGDLTILGRIISRLPIDIRLGKLICLGHVFDVLEDCIIIAACLSTQGMFRRDFGQGLNSYKSRLAWADRSLSDSIAHLNAYKTYKKFASEFDVDPKMADNWCKQNYIQYKRIKEVDYMIGELISRLSHESIVIPNRPNLRRNRNQEELILKVVMCAAFYPNYFTRNEIDVQRIQKELCNKDPMDSVYVQGLPPNEGPLYTHALRDMFSICSKRIDISFEETKAYLTFLEDKHPLKEAFDLQIPDKINKIKREIGSSYSSLNSYSSIKSEDRFTPITEMSSRNSTQSSATNVLFRKNLKETSIKTAVYVAIAMRHHREINKDLPKLNENTIVTEMKKIEKFQSEEHLRKLTFNSKRVSVPHSLTRMKLNRLSLPAFDCSEVELIITHIESPSLFYGQYAHKMTKDWLNDLSSIITYEITHKPCESELIQIGDLTIGELIQSNGAKMHGRARIDNIEYRNGTKEVETVTVFFIDYGVTKVFDQLNKLSVLQGDTPQTLFDIPPLAFKCSLSGVNPSPISCHDSCWSKKSIEFFKKFVEKKETMTAKIYSVINRVVRLELFDNVNREESFNDRLINIGLCEKWEESPQSKLNHEQRRRAQLTRDESIGPLRLEKLNQKGVYDPDDVLEIKVDFNPNQRNLNIRTHEKIPLKGPFSPLETSARSVSIDRGSVNCVVLESDYLSKHTRLLVASSIGLGQHSQNITLRDTTLMPNIRGFPALMALLFAPRVQLRANKERTQYVGAICGLGYNKKTKKSYDPDYDSEIIFDSEITVEDMIKVNIIRYNISSLLKSKESLREFIETSLAIKQKKIREYVIELLDHRRRLLDNTTDYHYFKWSDITADDVNSQLNKSDVEINSELLPLCEQPRLNEFNYFDDIKENLTQLKTTNENGVSMTTKCKLCKFTAYTFPDVSNHLSSDQHMDAIRDFNKEIKIYESELMKNEHYAQRHEQGFDEEEEADIFDFDSDEEYAI